LGLTLVLEPFFQEVVLILAFTAAELAADATRAREVVERAKVPSSQLTVPYLIRAAREGDFARIRQLEHARDQILAPLLPLTEALCAWAAEQANEPREVDKITLLAETGIEQVEQCWPEFAAFLRRAPALAR
jgi:hypothetical protein